VIRFTENTQKVAFIRDFTRAGSPDAVVISSDNNFIKVYLQCALIVPYQCIRGVFSHKINNE